MKRAIAAIWVLGAIPLVFALLAIWNDPHANLSAHFGNTAGVLAVYLFYGLMVTLWLDI